MKSALQNRALSVQAGRMEPSKDISLRRLQAGYSQLFESYPLPMLVVELATLRLLAANDAAAKCYGYSIAQLTEMHLPDVYFVEDHQALPGYLAMAPQERAKQRRWRHRGQGGRAIAVEIDTEDMELHGLPTCMLLVTDVTREQEEINEAKSPLKAIPSEVQYVNDGFFMVDHDARFVAVNAHAEALLDVKREQLLGRTLWECCPRNSVATYRANYEAVVLRRQAICHESATQEQTGAPRQHVEQDHPPAAMGKHCGAAPAPQAVADGLTPRADAATRLDVARTAAADATRRHASRAPPPADRGDGITRERDADFDVAAWREA